MISLTEPMAFTALFASPWIALIFRLISSVAVAVCFASSFTSFATTAKPAPTSPGRAASTVAFNAKRSVFWAIEVIALITWPISALDSPSFATIVFVSAAVFIAPSATLPLLSRSWGSPGCTLASASPVFLF
jgi:hypothetical protein